MECSFRELVEYQDGLLRFEHKAAMEDIGQRHEILYVGKILLIGNLTGEH